MISICTMKKKTERVTGMNRKKEDMSFNVNELRNGRRPDYRNHMCCSSWTKTQIPDYSAYKMDYEISRGDRKEEMGGEIVYWTK